MRDPDDRVNDVERLAALRATGLLDSPPEASFDRLARLAARLTHAPVALVSLVDEDRQFFKASVGLDEELTAKRETPLSQSVCRHVVDLGRPLVLSDTRNCSGIPSDLALAYLGIPLVTSDGHILGSFCVFDTSPREWSDDDLATMIDLAASVGTEIELRRDIARRARLERELSAANGRFEAYMRNSPAIAFAKDVDGRFTYFNATFQRHVGHDSDNWLGKTDHEVWPPDVADQLRANDEKVWDAGVSVEFVEETITNDGRRNRWLALKFPFVTPDGEKLLGGMAVDISDLLRTQEALRRSEAESRTLAMVVARIDGAVAIANADCRLDWVSEAYARLFGETPEALIGEDLIQGSLGPDADSGRGSTLRDRLMAGDRVEMAVTRRDSRGRKAWLELEVQAVRGEAGSPGQFIAIGRDVTDRRRSEARTAVLRACDAILFDSTTLDEAVPRLLQSIGQGLDLDEATYWRVDRESDRLVLDSRWVPGLRPSMTRLDDSTPLAASDGQSMGLGEQLAGRIWLENRAIKPGHLGLDEPTSPPGDAKPANFTPSSFPEGFGWPVVKLGQVVGIFSFSSQGPLEDPDAVADLSSSLGRQVGLFVDRKQAEEERNRLVAIFEASDDFVGIADANGLVIWRNAAFQKLLGQTTGGPVSGFPVESNYTDWAGKLLREVGLPEAARSGSWLGETAIRSSDGRVIPVSQRITGHRALDGRLTHYATILRDISASKAAEAELLAAKDAAEAASRAKGDFLANMSHEIRTPMNGIIGMTDLTLDTDLSPLQREYLGMARSSAEALLIVINDILDFSKIEAGRLELERVPFNLHDLVYETLRPLAFRAHAAKLDLACRIAPDVPEVVEGDPHRVRQIIVNLVGNAVKFTKRGEVIVEVTLGDPSQNPIAQPATDLDPEVVLHFAVIDTGIGIEPHKLLAIFEPFEQADGSTTRDYGGTGLGLSISTELVRLMGGRLWVESSPGQGSAFHFLGRMGRVEDQPEAVEVALMEGRRVLVAIENATRRRLTVELLEHWGAFPRESTGGLSALNELRQASSRGEPYDCAVVDDRLAELSGLDLISLIHADSKIKSTVLVVFTTAGRDGIDRCEDQRIATCLPKPVSARDLLKALGSGLKQKATSMLESRGQAEFRSVEGDANPSISTATSRPPLPLRKLRVLLGEDHLVNRIVAARMLERLGHSVATAQDGREVLAMLEDETFDLVLMDIQMPVMDGFETVAAIRSLHPTPIILIALTAHAMKGDRERCLAAGFDEYLSKPIRSDDLKETLERFPSLARPASVPVGASNSPAGSASAD